MSEPYGGRDTLLIRAKDRLGIQLLAFALVSLLLGIGVYFAVHALSSLIISDYLSGTDIQDKRLEQAADSLQNYVSENQISLDDKDALDAWVADERYVMLQIYSDGRVLYDSTMDVDLSKLDIPGGDAMQWQKTYTITFADGDGSAMFYEYFHMRDELIGTIISIILAALVFAVSLLLMVNRKSRYIRKLSDELHVLEGGDLDYRITVKGNDELGDLAQSIDDMRMAMVEREKAADDLSHRNYELVTAMSHDLRSPLTSLIGYLDILTSHKYHDEGERERYLRNSRAKAYQIKDISDDLFGYFSSYGDEQKSFNLETCDCDELMRELLDESLFELRSAGFNVDYRPFEFPGARSVEVDVHLLRRAFDNIFSNVLRHANPAQPVGILCTYEDGIATIRISNAMRPHKERVRGSGIGLRNAERIFRANDWQFERAEEGDVFSILVEFTSDALSPEPDTTENRADAR